MAHEIVDLTKDDPKALGRLTRAVETTVAKSFTTSPCRVTQAEIARRARLCMGIIRELRKEMHWSIERIGDELPRALRFKLDGVPWDATKARTLWSPEDNQSPGRVFVPDND